MYADEDARGGVLEPEGIVGIKFRRDKQLDTMARLDPTYGELRRASLDKTLSADRLSDIKVKLAAREELLLPVYSQIALHFADLHDRAGRMQAKNTIRQALVWKQARRFFYWRLRRRLNEESIVRKMGAAAPTTAAAARPTPIMTTITSPSGITAPSVNGTSITPSSSGQSNGNGNGSSNGNGTANVHNGTSLRDRNLELLQAWTSLAAPTFERDDRAVAMWYEENRKEVHAKIEAMRGEAVAVDVAALLRGNKDGGLKGVKNVLSMLPVEERESVLRFLSGQ